MISEFKINYVLKGKCKKYYLNGHDSWNDWAGDTNSPAVITKLFKLVCLEKQLGNDEIGPWNMKMKFLFSINVNQVRGIPNHITRFNFFLEIDEIIVV